jgi:hypothetical protein
VTNVGGAPTGVLTTATLGGPNAGDFAITDNKCVVPLAPLATCAIQVVFKPTLVGAETATLTVTDATVGSTPATATLIGTAIAPAMLAITGVQDLGIVTVGETGTASIYTLANSGGTASELLLVASVDAQFVVGNDMCTGFALAVAATCTFTVTFTPGAEGVRTTVLTAKSGAEVAAQKQIQGTGMARPVPPALSLKPPTLDFGSINVNTTAGPQTFTVTNTGGTASGVLSVFKNDSTSSVGGGSQFTYTTTCSAALAPAAACFVAVTYAPTIAGSASATITVTDGIASVLATVSGTGTSKKKGGQTCSGASECVSGACVGNVCSRQLSFATPATYSAHLNPHSIAIGDLNADGKPDLVVANWDSGDVSVLLGKGNGTFQAHADYAVGQKPSNVVVGDLNGDGKLDLATANAGSFDLGVLFGNGDGTFQPRQVVYACGVELYSVAAGDFNADGKLDLVVASNSADDVRLLLGDGHGAFQAPVVYAVGNDPTFVTVGDFNGDSEADLVTANGIIGIGTVSVLLGKSDGTFQEQVTYTVGDFPASIAVGDFNGDGKLDLVVGNDNSRDLSVLLGKGDGTFQTQTTRAFGTNTYSIAVGDYNGDGWPDLAIAGDAPLAVLLGNGDGTFRDQAAFGVGQHSVSVAVSDIDGDGRPDLVTANGGPDNVSVLMNTSN